MQSNFSLDLKVLQKNIALYLAEEKDAYFLNEARSIASSNNTELIADRFGSNLAFGTGGLRSVIGAGLNAINPYVVKKATLAVASYAIRQSSAAAASKSAVIAYDSRNYSKQFASEAAKVLLALDFKVYLFQEIEPVPLLSYAVRHLKATFGIMITASHNPAQYNGYKVYWHDGCQLLPPHDEAIFREMATIAHLPIEADNVKNSVVALEKHNEIDRAYLAAVQEALWAYNVTGKPQTVSYSPLHGAGYELVTAILEQAGYKVVVPQSQQQANGDFPTVKVPNPEYQETLTEAMALAKQTNAFLVLATDPDVDRLGVAVKHHAGYEFLNGNQLGALMLFYMASCRQKAQTLSSKHYFINTIVSSKLQNKIAQSFALKDYRVLTGFKYIGQLMEQLGAEDFLFGAEESYGFLVHNAIRDKDAVSAALLVANMARFYLETEHKSLIDKMADLYQRYGFFLENQLTFDYEGLAGQAVIKAIMQVLRQTTMFEGYKVEEIIDYETLLVTKNGYQKELVPALPRSLVVELTLEGGLRLIARPSGTEPKLKFYLFAEGRARLEVEERLRTLEALVQRFMKKY